MLRPQRLRVTLLRRQNQWCNLPACKPRGYLRNNANILMCTKSPVSLSRESFLSETTSVHVLELQNLGFAICGPLPAGRHMSGDLFHVSGSEGSRRQNAMDMIYLLLTYHILRIQHLVGGSFLPVTFERSVSLHRVDSGGHKYCIWPERRPRCLGLQHPLACRVMQSTAEPLIVAGLVGMACANRHDSRRYPR